MNDWTDDLQAGVEELAGEAGRSAGPHLEPDEIADYRDGRLSPADAARAQSHLVACRECAELLLDLEGLADPGFGADEPWSTADADAVWEGVRSGLRREEAPSAIPVIPFPAGRLAARPPRWLHALAAALLVAVLGLSTWVASLRHTVQELSRPEVNAPVLDLYPAGAERRGAGVTGPVEVPAGSRIFTLSLNPTVRSELRGEYSGYEVEIARAGGEVIQKESGLAPNAFGSFTVALSRQALGSGDFRIRLFGIRAGGREPIGEYALRIAPS